MKPKKTTPDQEWLRIVAEARPQQPPPPPDEPAPAWFVERALGERRAARRRAVAAAEGAWIAFPGLARAATASVVLAVACAVFVLSTGALDAFQEPLFPEPELEELDLP